MVLLPPPPPPSTQYDDQPTWHGYVIAVAMFASALVQSICLHQYFHRVMKTGMRLRSAIINVVYDKSLRLSNDGV